MVAGNYFLLLSILLCFALPKIDSAASNTLADCQAVASAFQTTINYTAANITATTGVNATCSASGVVCPGQTIGGVCVWQRKLSVVCRNSGGVIKIRIQTNGLPPRCASVPMGTFAALNVDFEVNFNPDVNVNSPKINLSTASALSQTICVLTYSSTVPSSSGFVNYGTTNLNTVTGISVDGVVMFSSDSIDNVDPFFPPAGYATEMVDSCLAHCQVAGVYHYHIASGCMVNPPSGTITSCAGNTNCNSNIGTYAMSSFSNYQNKTIIGIAKDGHIVYGPYLSSGTRVTSGFDICNGMFHDSIGNYAYFATSTYPYLVGCFGPGNYPSFGVNCSTNAPTSYTMSSYATSFLNSSTNSTSSTSSTSSTVASGSSTASTTSLSSQSSSTTTTLRGFSNGIQLSVNHILFFVSSISVLLFQH